MKLGIKYKQPFYVNGHLFREPLDMVGQINEYGKLIKAEEASDLLNI
jgi:hypothetical protein